MPILRGRPDINGGAVQATNTSALGGASNLITLNGGALWLNNSHHLRRLRQYPGGHRQRRHDRRHPRRRRLPGRREPQRTAPISQSDPTANNTEYSVTLSGQVTGTGSLIVGADLNNNQITGGKKVKLTAANDNYSGGTTINAGGTSRSRTPTRLVAAMVPWRSMAAAPAVTST